MPARCLILSLFLASTAIAEDHGRAMWVWEGWKTVSDPEKTRQLFELCSKPPSNAPKIDSLYVNLPPLNLSRENDRPVFASFISQAHARGIKVHLLAGSVELAYQASGGLKIIENLAAFNQAAPMESRFDGLHFDIEPHTMAAWSQDNRLRDRFIETMKKYFEKFSEIRGSMSLGIDISVGYADDKQLLSALLDSTDYVAIMDYRDSAGRIISDAEEILEAARKKGKKAVIGIETQRPNKKYGVTPMITFWDEGSERMEKVLKEVEEHFKSNAAYGGIAVHHFQSYAALTPEPQRIVDNRTFPELPAITAKFAGQPVKIDGDLSEWKDLPAIEIKEPREVVYGKGAWKSADDLSAKAWVGWDENNFYFAIDVTDDSVVQPFETRKMVNGDHVEVWLDLDYEKNKDTGTAAEGVYQLGLSPGNFADHPPGILDWLPGGLFKNKESQLEIKSVKTGKGYRMEVRLPWELLGEFRPADGKPFRINIDPSDTDGTEKPFQETLMSTSPHREWGNPKTFRNAVFKK